MTEAAGDQPERKRLAKMAAGMGKKAIGETLHLPEMLIPEQKVIDFVNQTAVFEGGETPDVVKAGVLTNLLAGGGLLLRSQIIDEIDTRTGERRGEPVHSLEVVYPGGFTDGIEIGSMGTFSYIFSGDGGGMFEDLDDKEREATVTSFFIRYNLDYYVQHPELWRPEARKRR